MVKGIKKRRNNPYKNKKNNISKRLKTIVWYHRIGINVGSVLCPSCGSNKISQSDFDCGHIVAESKNGSLDKSNLVPICRQCNLSMGNERMDDFMLSQFNRSLPDVIKQQKKYSKIINDLIACLDSKKSNKIKVKKIYNILKCK